MGSCISKLKQFARKRFLTSNDANVLTDKLNEVIDAMGITVSGVGASSISSRHGTSIAVTGGTTAGRSTSIRRAQVAVDWTTGTTTTVNLLNSDGNPASEGVEHGVTINFLQGYSANILPRITGGMIVPVFKDIDGKWYCIMTGVLVGSRTSDVGSNAGSLGGVLIYDWFRTW